MSTDLEPTFTTPPNETPPAEIVPVVVGEIVTRKDQLAEQEARIEKGFMEAGQALRAIKDQDLYKETHSAFQAYCLERWGMTKSYANRQIAAAKFVEEALPRVLALAGSEKVAPIGATLTTEAQVRELIHLADRPEDLREVLLAAGPNPPAVRLGTIVKNLHPKPAAAPPATKPAKPSTETPAPPVRSGNYSAAKVVGELTHVLGHWKQQDLFHSVAEAVWNHSQDAPPADYDKMVTLLHDVDEKVHGLMALLGDPETAFKEMSPVRRAERAK